ncbi:efflux transporter outer membrane subunit [Sphingomonas sp.]|uniref:efflux transporter outer membrane subunit n=1 Tax=Sphingomonas sp. TaxID=28214 RepID=UPI0028A90B01|nr:efflux transporter outer membrane subunit [Sphingomonas sp.]
MRRTSMIALVLLAGCTVGPHDLSNPVPTPPPRAPGTIAPTSGAAQQLVAGAAVVPNWWQGFGSARLDALVAQALAHNNDLAAAEANLRQAQELTKAASGSTGPQVDASYQAQRTRISKALSGPLADQNDYLYTLHTAQLSVAYPLDLFGAGRNKVRSARAAAEVAAHRLHAAQATAVANLVLAVIQHATLQAQIEATQSAIRDNRDLVDLLEKRRKLGDIGEADVGAQQTALATIEATLPLLLRQAQHQAGLIATLTGQAPGTAGDLPTLAELQLPASLPLALPADIVASRPDVRAAEAQVRGAAADVGSAIAARLPAITLSGNAGGSATKFLDMFQDGNPFFSIVGGITQPIFHAGQLKHQQHAAEAALEEAKAQYRATALQAFLDVDDAIAGLRTDAEALNAASRADAAASRTLAMTRRQVELGALGTLQLLNAASAASQASVQLVQAKGARLADSVALYLASGSTPADLQSAGR